MELNNRNDWHSYYLANTLRWCVPDAEFINLTVQPIGYRGVDRNGNRNNEVQCVRYDVGQKIFSKDGKLVRYSNAMTVYVDANKAVDGLRIGDAVKLDGLQSYYVRGFTDKKGRKHKGTLKLRADGIRKVGTK